jgi:hypothetical protein
MLSIYAPSLTIFKPRVFGPNLCVGTCPTPDQGELAKCPHGADYNGPRAFYSVKASLTILSPVNICVRSIAGLRRPRLMYSSTPLLLACRRVGSHLAVL